MSFSDREISNEDGKPIGLYLIKWGPTEWRYTSADRDITRVENGEEVTYTAVAISDSGVIQGGDQDADMTIDIPANLPVVALFRSTPPAGSIFVTVRRQHAGEDDAPIYWKGTIGNVKRLTVAGAQILGRVLTASFKRAGLRLTWTRGCPHVLYDQDCKVNRAEYAVPAVITALTGNSFTIDLGPKASDPTWFAGGFIEWAATEEGAIDRRSIEREITTGNDLANERQRFVIFGTTDRLEVGTEITMYPGCPLTPDACDGKFDNLPNYGGFQYLAGESPFEGAPVF